MSGKGVVVHKIPKLVNGRGTLPINQSYEGVGKIRVASGTKDPNTYLAILKAMDGVYNAGNLDTLESLRDKVITPLELLQSVKKSGVHKVININTSVLLIQTILDWLEHHNIKETTRRGYKSHLDLFFKTCKATDTIKDLTKKFEAYRKVCIKKDTARSFNQCRAALLAFAKSEYKKKSSIYIDLSDIEVLPVKKKLKNDAVGVEDVVTFTSVLEDPFPQIIWDMCYTGLRISEYLETLDTTWEVKVDRIEVTNNNVGHGNKGGNRIVMLPYHVDKPTRKHQAIRRAFIRAKKATGISLTPHSTRKCFDHWCNEAGISDVRIKAYMGHQSMSITQMYRKHEVDSHLASDAKLFKDYVEGIRNPKPKKKTIKMLQMGPMGMEEVEVEVE